VCRAFGHAEDAQSEADHLPVVARTEVVDRLFQRLEVRDPRSCRADVAQNADRSISVIGEFGARQRRNLPFNLEDSWFFSGWTRSTFVRLRSSC
jgi:hypothetical protein